MKKLAAYLIVLAIPVFGYANNIVKLVMADFAAPYKNEVIRTAGVFIPPVGMIAGYFNIKDGE